MVQSETYEITVTGQAGTAIRAAFDDCQVRVDAGTTTLHAELPDQAALHGLLQRIASLRLQILRVELLNPNSPAR